MWWMTKQKAVTFFKQSRRKTCNGKAAVSMRSSILNRLTVQCGSFISILVHLCVSSTLLLSALCLCLVWFVFLLNPYDRVCFLFQMLWNTFTQILRLNSVSDQILIVCDLCLQPWGLLCRSTFKASDINLCLRSRAPAAGFSG